MATTVVELGTPYPIVPSSSPRGTPNPGSGVIGSGNILDDSDDGTYIDAELADSDVHNQGDKVRVPVTAWCTDVEPSWVTAITCSVRCAIIGPKSSASFPANTNLAVTFGSGEDTGSWAFLGGIPFGPHAMTTRDLPNELVGGPSFDLLAERVCTGAVASLGPDYAVPYMDLWCNGPYDPSGPSGDMQWRFSEMTITVEYTPTGEPPVITAAPRRVRMYPIEN